MPSYIAVLATSRNVVPSYTNMSVSFAVAEKLPAPDRKIDASLPVGLPALWVTVTLASNCSTTIEPFCHPELLMWLMVVVPVISK